MSGDNSMTPPPAIATRQFGSVSQMACRARIGDARISSIKR